MKKIYIVLLMLQVVFTSFCFSQKDSLNIGDRYADDQLYASISYAQLFNQPTGINKSDFSYSLSTGFLKDIILNKQGSISIAAGIGYGFTNFNHDLRVDEVNNMTVFNTGDFISSKSFKSHSLELPFEVRWRTSTANKYSFWRIYSGIKFLYDISHSFSYTDADNNNFKFNSVSAFNKLQYGLTLSAGYDEFNINLFYGVTPIFNDGFLNGERVAIRVLKFGLIFYFL